MSMYYEQETRDLQAGRTAKAEDITLNLQKIEDAFKQVVKDFTDQESWILGQDKDAFLLTLEKTRAGRYIDQMNIVEDDANLGWVSIRETSYRQPIRLSRSSIYSIIVKMVNKSEKDVSVLFSLRDENGDLLPGMITTLDLKANTNPTDFEIIFDLDYYPTSFGLNPVALENSENPDYTDSSEEETNDEDTETSSSNITDNNNISESDSIEDEVSQEEASMIENATTGEGFVYLCIDALNKNKQEAFDINNTQSNGYTWNDEDPTFGIAINKNSTYGQLLEEDTGSGFLQSTTKADLYFKEIFAVNTAYKCNPGTAIIDGTKVDLIDTHISIGGGSSEGDVTSYVYMDIDGHLGYINNIKDSEEEELGPHLHIADITTYLGDYQNPVIEQNDELLETRPRSHHERIRRLEKISKYTQDVAIPPRFKYTLTGEDWIDPDPSMDLLNRNFDPIQASEIDNLSSNSYTMTTDENGNFAIKFTKAQRLSIPITFKSKTSGKVTTQADKQKIISSAQTSKYIEKLKKDDIARAQTFAVMKNLRNNITTGELYLDDGTEGITLATTAKQAKKTVDNIWDDTKANRPTSDDVKPKTRAYVVKGGKNAAKDKTSEYPGMTFYVKKNSKLKSIHIPITKFKGCSGVNLHVFKRQKNNNKKNTVWLKEQVYRSKKPISLAKAKKTKNGIQILDIGLRITLKDGLKLDPGQYVIVVIPVPKGNRGVMYVDTYKPKNSRDFCIRYCGDSKGKHFNLKERYQEIWYNPGHLQVEEIDYSKKGVLESGVVTWEDREPIMLVKPLMNRSIPKGTDITIYVDVGGGWQEVTRGKYNNVHGSGKGSSFRWKLVLTTTNTDKTPKIVSSKKTNNRAIEFILVRAEPETSKLEEVQKLEDNMCLTSKVIDADKILRDYIGDMNLAITNSKFSNFEFGRIWASDDNSNALKIDISGSDTVKPLYEIKDGNAVAKTEDGQQLYYPVFSFHYVDLTLQDIPQVSVDYSHYDELVEEDEHNLRFKMDTENSYNDNEIKVVDFSKFQLTDEKYKVKDSDSSEETESGETESVVTESGENESEESESSNKESSSSSNGLPINIEGINKSDTNTIVAKATFDQSLDFTKYSGIKIGLKLNGSVGGSISGLGFYISSQEEEDIPTNKVSDEILKAEKDGLPDLNISQDEITEKYKNKVIYNPINMNGTSVNAYYKCVYNSSIGGWEWQQVHDIKSYDIYEIIDRSNKNNTLEITEKNNGVEQFFEINIDKTNPILQNVKEIGFMLLTENEDFAVNNVSDITITDFKAIRNDYYNVFKAADKNVFKRVIGQGNRSPITVHAHKSLGLDGGSKTYNETTPPTSLVKINHQKVLAAGEDLCYFDMTSKSTEGFNHIGIQIASDTLLTKNMLELQLRKIDEKTKVEKTIETIKLPTLNYGYDPIDAHNMITLSQVMKKIKTTERFDKIVLCATSKFREYATKIKDTQRFGEYIYLYIGNIALYRAETMPFMYPRMRMKFYLDDGGEIDKDKTQIRKIGAVIQYN